MPSQKTRRWLTAAQLREEQQWLSDASLRQYVFRANQNGLAPHIRRVGRRVLIDGDGFARWIEEQDGRAAA